MQCAVHGYEQQQKKRNSLAATQTLLFVRWLCLYAFAWIFTKMTSFSLAVFALHVHIANGNKTQQYMRSKCSILFELRLHKTHTHTLIRAREHMNSAIFTQYMCFVYLFPF